MDIFSLLLTAALVASTAGAATESNDPAGGTDDTRATIIDTGLTNDTRATIIDTGASGN